MEEKIDSWCKFDASVKSSIYKFIGRRENLYWVYYIIPLIAIPIVQIVINNALIAYSIFIVYFIAIILCELFFVVSPASRIVQKRLNKQIFIKSYFKLDSNEDDFIIDFYLNEKRQARFFLSLDDFFEHPDSDKNFKVFELDGLGLAIPLYSFYNEEKIFLDEIYDGDILWV